jgi:hypothetical protein
LPNDIAASLRATLTRAHQRGLLQANAAEGTCAEGEHVVNGACVACPAGTSRLAGDKYLFGPDTTCLKTCATLADLDADSSCQLLLGDFSISEGSQTTLSYPNLVQIKGKFYLHNMNSLTGMTFDKLEAVGGDFELKGVRECIFGANHFANTNKTLFRSTPHTFTLSSSVLPVFIFLHFHSHYICV